MTASEIRRKRQELLGKEQSVHEAMRSLQEQCEHEHTTRSIGFYGDKERSICETCEDCGHVAYSD